MAGDRVKVIYECARVEAADDCGLMRVSVGQWQTVVNLRNAGVSVEKADPEGWPPQVGDIWADKDGDEWVATSREPDSAVRLYLVDYDRSSPRSADELSDLQPMRLLRRREVPDA
jgi:hypothetical protein